MELLNSRRHFQNGRIMKVKLVTMAVILASGAVLARPVVSGDVLGRDMDVPVLGKIGHLAMATGDNIFGPTDTTIEMEPNGKKSIVWGTVKEFKKKTKYWGSRSGLITDRNHMYTALNEGKKQSFWCPEYSTFPVYIAGIGYFDSMGKPHATKCGKFRCDTFVGYLMAFGDQPAIVNNLIQAPYNAFMTFPVDNKDKAIASNKIHSEQKEPSSQEQKFLDLTVKAINSMTLSELTPFLILDPNNKSKAVAQKEWELIADENLYEVYREGFIDLRGMSKDEDSAMRFIRLYSSIKSEKVKTRIISGLMYFYQNNWEELNASPKFEAIKRFYEKLLKQNADKERSANIIRGFVDLHDANEVKQSLVPIERHLAKIDKKLLVGLQFEIIRKSPELQKMFLPKTISTLREANSAELDSMAFYYLNNGVAISDNKSKKMLKNLILERKEVHRSLKDDIESYHAKSAEKDMNELLKKLN